MKGLLDFVGISDRNEALRVSQSIRQKLGVGNNESIKEAARRHGLVKKGR